MLGSKMLRYFEPSMRQKCFLGHHFWIEPCLKSVMLSHDRHYSTATTVNDVHEAEHLQKVVQV